VTPVYLLYLTAFTDDDGTVEFRDDIYGRDQDLAAALADREIRRRMASMLGAG
jgi:murein L,D-transpeptidase YcbB/YkuD